jgi:hypothetical protein
MTTEGARVVLPVWRDDGTVYLQAVYFQEPLSERLCRWGVVCLWLSSVGVALGAVLWR